MGGTLAGFPGLGRNSGMGAKLISRNGASPLSPGLPFSPPPRNSRPRVPLHDLIPRAPLPATQNHLCTESR